MVKEFGLDERLRLRYEQPQFRDRVKMSVRRIILFPLSIVRKLRGRTQKGGEADWLDRAAAEFRSGSSAWIDVRPVEGTDMVRLAVNGETPQLAMDIANAMVRRLREILTEVSVSASRNVAKAYAGETDKAEAKLDEAERALRLFKEAHGGIAPTEEARIKVARLADLTAAYSAVSSEKSVLDARRQRLLESPAEDLDMVVSSSAIERNDLIQGLRSGLHAKRVALAALLSERTEAHPEVVNVRSEIKQIREELDRELGNVIRAMETDMLSRDKEIKQLQAELLEIPAKELEFARLSLQVATHRQIFAELQSHLEQLSVETDSGVGNLRIKVLDKAHVSPTARPSSPKALLIIVLALFFSGGLSLVLPCFLEYWRDPVKGPLDLHLHGMECLAVVPPLKRPAEMFGDQASK
jgi:uncharacterized protein involved in exopolysaccharide biosynthesis